MNTIQLISLLAVTLFYAIYFQRQFALRRRGIRADRLGKGQKERKTRRVEAVLLAVSWSMPVAQYASILADWGCAEAPAWFGWTGVVVAFAGAVCFGLAVAAMQENWRAGIDASQKTELVTRGIYRISRNPAFVGFDLLYIGTAIAFPNLVLIGLTLVAVTVFHLQIRQEEHYMRTVFGTDYADYARKTRRYLGNS
ncbi:MAG: isoprenylcysteine carboxylmethyltransferase family protein [Rikenellaceae bacterium]|nr:isoprenylcysteine carboxylmethyltransferase family protein [Rikenellaceae bacterium]